MKWKLDKDTAKMVAETAEALRATLDEGRTAWEEKSQRWQDSDAGTNAAAWLDELEAAADALDNIPEQAFE